MGTKILTLALILLNQFLFSQSSNCNEMGYIIKLKTDKCSGCPGWYLSNKTDTVKVIELQELEDYIENINFPIKVYYSLGTQSDMTSIDYPYYTLNCIEVPCFDQLIKDSHSGICTADYRPVCGCDGRTYSNECSSKQNGINISTDGECK